MLDLDVGAVGVVMAVVAAGATSARPVTIVDAKFVLLSITIALNKAIKIERTKLIKNKPKTDPIRISNRIPNASH